MDRPPPHVQRRGAPGAGPTTLVFIHGAGHDHSVWALPARELARLGWRTLAPDLPDHGLSPGPVRGSIETLADWIVDLLAAEQATPATLVGHSMGSLVALEAAARAPAATAGLVLVGCTFPMPVSPALLEAARADRDLAHGLINQWSFSTPVQLGNPAQPGLHLPGVNRRLMERQPPGVLHADLAACHAYDHGLEAARAVRCPTLLVGGSRDQMTPVRALGPLREALCHVPGGARMISLPGAGHNVLAEAPGDLVAAIRGFLQEK